MLSNRAYWRNPAMAINVGFVLITHAGPEQVVRLVHLMR